MDNQEIKILVTDLDGVLTDGKLTIDHTGKKMFKQFHTRDVRAIRELISNGWEVYIVSADDHESGTCFAHKVGAEFILMRDKGGVPAMLNERPYYCIGDDAWDIPMLNYARKKFCPADASRSVMSLINMNIISIYGGHGVIAELIHHLPFPL